MINVMPMTHGSTTTVSSVGNVKSMKSPSKATIELIRQFARTCTVVKDMTFDVMMAN